MAYKHFRITIKVALICIAALMILSCGGGGGGMVSFQDNPGIHNNGDAGGFGTGNQTGNGFNPQGQNIEDAEAGPLISQMAALDNITTVRIELTINGVPQPAIIADATTTKDVLPRIGPNDTVSGIAYINLSNGTTRVAQLDETHVELGKALPFKVPYYYRCVNSSGAEIVSSTEYFSRDGINLSDYTTENMAGWLCTNDGTMHNGSYVSGVRGDITLTPVYNAPDCTITVTPPGTATETASGSGIYKITNISDSFGFVVGLSDGTSFPAGTNTTWQINGTAFSGTTPETCGAAPDDVGITVASIGSNATNASTMTINCLINIPGEPQAAVTKTIKVFKPVTLTGFDIYVDYNIYTGTEYPVYNTATPVNFSVFTAAGLPLGTVYNWTITNAVDGTVVTRQGAGLDSINVTPAEMGSIGTTESTATTLTVSCTISHPDTAVSGESVTQTLSPAFKVYKFTIPAFTITFTPAAGSYNTANSNTSAAVPVYAMTDTTTAFTIKAVPTAGSFPAGTKFDWTVNGYTMSGVTQHSDTLSTNFASIGLSNLSTSSASPTSFSITCTAHDDHDPQRVSKNADDMTVKVYKLTIPDFKITVTPPTGLVSKTEGTGSSAVTTYLPINATDMASSFGFDVELVNDSENFFTGTTFTWSFDNVAGVTSAKNATVTTLTGSSSTPTTTQNVTVTCTAKYTGCADKPVNVTIKFGSPFDVRNLGAYLESLPENDADHPYSISITGLSLNTWGSNVDEMVILKNALKNNPGKYVDLRGTTLPSGLTGMYMLFMGCETLVYAPQIPNTVTNLNQTFRGCSNLRTPPTIPPDVEDMNECFECCTSLTSAPEIPSLVKNLDGCFAGCGTSLTGNVVIRSTVLESADGTFRYLYGNKPSNITAIYVPSNAMASKLGTWNDDWIKTAGPGGTSLIQIGTP